MSGGSPWSAPKPAERQTARPPSDLQDHHRRPARGERDLARADRTGQSALEDTLSLLSACDDLKLVLNAAHFSPSGRRFGSYYGQGG